MRTIAPKIVESGRTVYPAPDLDVQVDAMVVDGEGTAWLVEARVTIHQPPNVCSLS